MYPNIDPSAGGVGPAAEAADHAVDLRPRKRRRQNACRELSRSSPPSPTPVARDSAVYNMEAIVGWRERDGAAEFLVK